MYREISEKELFERGFVQVEKSPFETDSVDRVYQKCYRDGHRKRYFLNVKHYKLIHPVTKEDLSGYEISGQFYLKGNHNAVNMNFLFSTIDEVENTIEKMFSVGIFENYDEDEV